MPDGLTAELFDDNGRIITDQDVRDLVARGVKVAREAWKGVHNGVEAIRRYVVTDLPTQFGVAIERVGDYLRPALVPLGKVFGAYDPKTMTLYIDRAVAYATNPIRKLLQKYGMMMDPVEVVAHEVGHGIQKAMGILNVYKSREMIEGLNQYMTESRFSRFARKLVGQIRPYRLETMVAEQLIRRYGLNAITRPETPEKAALYEREFNQIYQSLQPRGGMSLTELFRRLVESYQPNASVPAYAPVRV